MMKKFLFVILYGLFVLNPSYAEWQLVNENDPKDAFMIFADFHNITELNDHQFHIKLKTSQLPDSAISSFPMKIYEPIGKFRVVLDCKNKIISTNNIQLYGKMRPSGELVDVMQSLGVPDKKEISKSRPLVQTDIVDMNLYNRICKL